MLKKSILITLLAMTVIFQGCGDTKKEEVKEANKVLSSNEFILTSTDNEQYIVKKEADGFVVENTNGKVVIFDIFATWCPPCQASAIHLTSLQKKYKDNVVVIGITIEENVTNEKLKEFKKEYKADYVIVNSKRNRALINELALALNLGKRFPIPIMILYKDGKLISHYIGEVQEEFVQSDIKRALHL
ncbi:MAG: TlpA family protein disulfide reductase [Sulfurimonas sp.]|nr:TlpA family protein disulfide reductase [Sulfurimonas sp.]